MVDPLPSADDDRDTLSPAEFALRNGLSESTVRRYIKAGKLPHEQPAGFRGRILIPVDALAKNPQPITSPSDPLPSPDTTRPSTPSGPRPRWQRGNERSSL